MLMPVSSVVIMYALLGKPTADDIDNINNLFESGKEAIYTGTASVTSESNKSYK